MVRVPLGGRRVGGWVVGLSSEAATDRPLRPLAKVTGRGPSPDLVDLASWAAWRWAGRRSAFLKTASPPRAVAGLPHVSPSERPPAAAAGSLAADAFGSAGSVAVVRVPPADDVMAFVLEASTAGRRAGAGPVAGDGRLPRRPAPSPRGGRGGGAAGLGPCRRRRLCRHRCPRRGWAPRPCARRRARAGRGRRGLPGGTGADVERARCRRRTSPAGGCAVRAGVAGAVAGVAGDPRRGAAHARPGRRAGRLAGRSTSSTAVPIRPGPGCTRRGWSTCCAGPGRAAGCCASSIARAGPASWPAPPAASWPAARCARARWRRRARPWPVPRDQGFGHPQGPCGGVCGRRRGDAGAAGPTRLTSPWTISGCRRAGRGRWCARTAVHPPEDAAGRRDACPGGVGAAGRDAGGGGDRRHRGPPARHAGAGGHRGGPAQGRRRPRRGLPRLRPGAAGAPLPRRRAGPRHAGPGRAPGRRPRRRRRWGRRRAHRGADPPTRPRGARRRRPRRPVAVHRGRVRPPGRPPAPARDGHGPRVRGSRARLHRGCARRRGHGPVRRSLAPPRPDHATLSDALAAAPVPRGGCGWRSTPAGPDAGRLGAGPSLRRVLFRPPSLGPESARRVPFQTWWQSWWNAG